MKKLRRTFGLLTMAGMLAVSLSACGSGGAASSQNGSAGNTSAGTATTASASANTTTAGNASAGTTAAAKDLITTAAKAGKVGNWGYGNQYEIQALLAKYSLPTNYLTQAFDMDAFDSDSIWLASAMTYNELGLVKNSYEGGYGYGKDIGTIDMNDEGVAMLEDNLFCTKEFAKENPNTVKAFISASLKGWKYACEHPEEAAKIVYQYGSSVSADHQAYMAAEVKKLVETDTAGKAVTNIGEMPDSAMQQTLDLAKKYIQLDDSAATAALKTMKLDDIRNASYFTDCANHGTPEKSSVSIQLKWLPQAQFMGYFVADSLGYYKEAGLTVNIVSGGGDISETVAVQNGTVDFGVTWVSNLISADASGSSLVEVAQIFQRSGLVLCYKQDNKNLIQK